MKYKCSNCGQIFDGRLDKCPNCGKKLKYKDPEPEKEQPKEEVKEEQPKVEEPKVEEQKVEEQKVEEQPKVEEAPKEEAPALVPAPVNQNEVAPLEEEKKEAPVDLSKSVFDGKTIQLIGWYLLGGLVTCVTLGLLFPLALCWLLRWFFAHSTIDGKRLVFQGRAMSMFWKNLLYEFLTIITIGIFGLFVPVKWCKWIIANTHFKAE